MTQDWTPFRGTTVLVIEDEAIQRALTRECLETHGFLVEEAASGEDGLAMLDDLRPDLVLLDVMMPGMDGFEVCRRMREHKVFRQIPVIIATGKEGLEDIQQGFAVGATDFLLKPVQWQLLPYRVAYVLKTARLEQDLRFAKDAAEKSNNAKTSMLSTMGHELRTPLNAVIGFSDLILKGAYGPIGNDKYEEFIGDINSSGNKLLRGINDILEIVKSDGSVLEGDSQAVKLGYLVDTVLQDVSGFAKELGVEFDVHIDDPDLLLNVDERKLGRALYALLSNAVKFTDGAGSVSIKSDRSPLGGLLLIVEDWGVGISDDDADRIFRPFEQADGELARRFEGMGLGLPLAQAIARLHGGDVLIKSRAGSGTTATLILPPERVGEAVAETAAPDFKIA